MRMWISIFHFQSMLFWNVTFMCYNYYYLLRNSVCWYIKKVCAVQSSREDGRESNSTAAFTCTAHVKNCDLWCSSRLLWIRRTSIDGLYHPVIIINPNHKIKWAHFSHSQCMHVELTNQVHVYIHALLFVCLSRLTHMTGK